MTIFRSRVRWVLIVWMLVISAVSFLDRVNISIAGPSIEREFHLDHIRLGWVFSAWVLGYALFQAPSGRLADRFGPRKILTLGAVWWAIFTALTALTPAHVAGALFILLIVRFALGVGESIVYPSGQRIDFRGRRAGRVRHAALDRLHHSASRLAMVLRDLRVAGPRGRRALVAVGAGSSQ